MKLYKVNLGHIGYFNVYVGGEKYISIHRTNSDRGFINGMKLTFSAIINPRKHK
jgi:hypothetical protein